MNNKKKGNKAYNNKKIKPQKENEKEMNKKSHTQKRKRWIKMSVSTYLEIITLSINMQ